MTKYKWIFMWVLVWVNMATSHAQEPINLARNYEPLKSYGPMPKDFREMSVNKYLSDRQTLESKGSRKDRQAKDKFLLASNYGIDNILHSGKVIYGDPVTEYINKVADKLLERDPQLRKALRFYTVKSSEVNAFSTNQGMIFVHVGLLAQVQNEAQFAFVLAHEIGHYVEKHVINAYVDASRLSRDKDFNQLKRDDKLVHLSNYSKENEFDADRFALEMMLKSDYDIKAASGVFDVLQYSYLPFDEVPFDKSFFSWGDFRFSDSFFLNAVKEIQSEADYDDSKSSHPNIRKRIEQYDALLMKKGMGSGSKSSIVGQKEFEHVRWLCRMESSRIYLVQKNYPMAIYNSYLILKEFPDNAFAHSVIGRSLYYLSKYYTNQAPLKSFEHEKRVFLGDKPSKEGKKLVINHNKIEGESQQLYYFLSKLSAKEMAVLATRYLWESHAKYGDINGLAYFSQKAVEDLVFWFRLDPQDFHAQSKEALLSSKSNTPEPVKEEPKATSKYDKIKQQSKTKEDEGAEEVWRFAFPETMPQYNKFKNIFTTNAVEAKEIMKGVEELKLLSFKEKNALKKQLQKEERRLEKRGHSLGADKVVVYDPYYIKGRYYVNREEGEVNPIDSELRKKWFNDQLRNSANKAGLEIDILTRDELKINDTETFNELTLINDWVNERLGHKSTIENVSEYYVLQDFMKEHNTNYLFMSAVSASRVKDPGRKAEALFALYYFFTAPYVLYEILRPYYSTDINTVLFDLTTGEVVYYNNESFNKPDSRDYINSYLYKEFKRIKRSPKK